MSDFDRGLADGRANPLPPGKGWVRCGGVTARGERCQREGIVPVDTPYRCRHHPKTKR